MIPFSLKFSYIETHTSCKVMRIGRHFSFGAANGPTCVLYQHLTYSHNGAQADSVTSFGQRPRSKQAATRSCYSFHSQSMADYQGDPYGAAQNGAQTSVGPTQFNPAEQSYSVGANSAEDHIPRADDHG